MNEAYHTLAEAQVDYKDMHRLKQLLGIGCFIVALGGVIEIEHEQTQTYAHEVCMNNQQDRFQLNKRVFYLNTLKRGVIEEADTETARDRKIGLKPRKSVSFLKHTSFERLPEISC